MFSNLKNVFKVPDLRNKILFLMAMVLLYRLGVAIRVPGIDDQAVRNFREAANTQGALGFFNMFSGGAFASFSIFALGIMPYITASIIIQLLTVVIPRLEALRKEGQSGQAKMTQYTRYLTIGLSVLQATAFVSLARTPGQLFTGCNENLIPNQSIPLIITMVITMTAGAATLMWFGELITDRGVGNGMSLLIFVSIIAGMPGQFWSIYQSRGTFILLLTLAVGVVIIAAVVYVEQAQRRIPVQYAKKMVGSRLMGGASTYIPLKVNMAGVIPVIFASSLLYIPQLLATVSGNTNSGWGQFIARNLSRGTEPLYVLFYVAMIIFFAYFYVSITFNPVEVSDNMKKYGGFIPGIRAGKPTEQYLAYVLSRLTFPGSIYLAIVAVIPLYAFGSLGVGQSFIFGGTSLLIMVGVGLDTVKQIEAQLQQRSYEGFLR